MRAHSTIFSGALTPDHALYSGPKPCVVDDPADEANSARRSSFTAETQDRAADRRRSAQKGSGSSERTTGKSPRPSELFASAVASSLLAGGDLQPLGPREVEFIMNWEAEHYRAKVIENSNRKE